MLQSYFQLLLISAPINMTKHLQAVEYKPALLN